jgi:hypothetical protein
VTGVVGRAADGLLGGGIVHSVGAGQFTEERMEAVVDGGSETVRQRSAESGADHAPRLCMPRF